MLTLYKLTNYLNSPTHISASVRHLQGDDNTNESVWAKIEILPMNMSTT